ncbi:subtilisin-like protein [Xylariaceae sp. FL0255]|nr:subtilisin-like protein [Xylariaceae sp. FL0255]
MATITVNGNTIDPDADHHVSTDAKHSDFIYVQGHNDLSIKEKQDLAELGVDIQEYVAEYTYLCYYKPADLDKVRALPFVKSANIYHSELKSTISLKQMVDGDADQTEYQVDLILHDHQTLSSMDLAPAVAHVADVAMNQLEIAPTKIRLTVHQDKLSGLAKLDAINRIEEVRQKSLYNDLARGTLQADSLTIKTRYQGEGQLVCVADSGFDRGLARDNLDIKVHPAFAGRVDRLDALWPGHDARDPIGHGTHVCGSILGNGVYKDPAQGADPISVKGTAPSARLMMQSISEMLPDGKWHIRTPVDLYQLFLDPYRRGARIHNNSWGDKWDYKTGQLGYENDATTIDRFIYDHQDFVILIAAGNDATAQRHGISQIGDNSAAKNCITVGATGTSRPNDGIKYDPKQLSTLTKPCKYTDTATTSSRGPTKSTLDSNKNPVRGRIKPDVAAPGVCVLSAASRSLPLDAKYRQNFGPSADADWLYLSGSSMATPLVSGCAALIREALQKHSKMWRPSAALVKALLINGAVNYNAIQNKSDLGYDYEQGFGLVNVDSSIAMVEQSSFVDGSISDNASQKNLFPTAHDVPTLCLLPETSRSWVSPPIPIPNDRNRLAVTLTYPDLPGALLQNDVNLIVRAGDAERYGNMGSSGTEFDTVNNVEKVIWEDVPGSTITIIAQANSFTKTDVDQSFAVAWDFRAL